MPRTNTNARPRTAARPLSRRKLAVGPTVYVRVCRDCGNVELSETAALMAWRECPACSPLRLSA